MTCNFQVGQKVVCIDDLGTPEFFKGLRLARKGQVYTVRSIFHWREQTLIRLEEIVNKVCRYQDGGKYEPGFEAECFRPLVTRKTDISIFKSMLNPSRERADV